MSTETPYIVVLVAAGSSDEARSIAREAVAQRLAACAQILPIQSVYEWQGTIEEDNEHLVLLKTRREVYTELEARICEIHSYDVPEIIALPVVAGLDAYMQWLSGYVLPSA
jgi:periplasmic divalent cation tolerance protein